MGRAWRGEGLGWEALDVAAPGQGQAQVHRAPAPSRPAGCWVPGAPAWGTSGQPHSGSSSHPSHPELQVLLWAHFT